MMTNLFSNLPADLTEEVIETLLKNGSVRIERIVSHGHASPAEFWYDQPDDEELGGFTHYKNAQPKTMVARIGTAEMRARTMSRARRPSLNIVSGEPEEAVSAVNRKANQVRYESRAAAPATSPIS